MKTKLLLLLIVLSSQFSYAQQHSIRFVHIGIEDIPICTVVVSVEKLIKATDHKFDDVCGVSLKTDMWTYQTIKTFIDAKKYPIIIKGRPLDYKIVIDNKKVVYLSVDSEYPFFERLKRLLLRKKCDQAVSEALKNKPF